MEKTHSQVEKTISPKEGTLFQMEEMFFWMEEAITQVVETKFRVQETFPRVEETFSWVEETYSQVEKPVSWKGKFTPVAPTPGPRARRAAFGCFLYVKQLTFEKFLSQWPVEMPYTVRRHSGICRPPISHCHLHLRKFPPPNEPPSIQDQFSKSVPLDTAFVGYRVVRTAASQRLLGRH